MSFHFLRFAVVFQPPFRSVEVRVLAESVLVAVQDPTVHRDFGVRVAPFAVNFQPTGGHKASYVQADRRSHPHSFL